MNQAPPSHRPNPDILLARLDAKSMRQRRGKLKIFFGAYPGVGKTYAMLTSARVSQSQGRDVVAGVVETHDHHETALLLQQIEILPRRRSIYKDLLLEEFNLEAALTRSPQLILIDELAHANPPDARHPKRWQDIKELLMAGIDVWTTLNVQHVESLHDVIGKITNIREWERIPDHVLDQADEMVLVDLPPEELLQRLQEGKVFIPKQVKQAMDNFFHKGNLLALRELALRRTADRIESDLRAWRREKSVTTVWPTRESVLVCVGPGPDSERLVRRAARRAKQTTAPWHAIAIETPTIQTLQETDRSRILAVLKMAQEMGAQTANLSSQDAVVSTIAYAREYNLGTVLVGRDRYRRLPWQHSFAEKLGRMAPDLELLQIAREEDERDARASRRIFRPRTVTPWRDQLLTFLIVALVTAGTAPLYDLLNPANIVMIFLLAVVFTAIRLGRGAAILSAFLAVASFDFFFVPPRFTFAVHNAQYLVTFAVMLTVALVVGQLTANLRFQVRNANRREQRMRALYEMSKNLSSALSVEQIVKICQRFIKQGFHASVAVFIPDQKEQLLLSEGSLILDAVDPDIAQWSFEHGQSAGLTTNTLPSARAIYIPLKAPTRLCGVLAVVPNKTGWKLPPEQQQLLDTSATLIAIALERLHYVILARDAQVGMESEQLRNSLLSAISHDLRTPLTVISGLTDAMRLATPILSNPHADLAQAIRDEVAHTITMVNNLLDMARMQMGHVVLKREWQTLEEIIGLSMGHCAPLLTKHTIHINLPPELPLLELDTGLMERVFNNLLENAAKHTPAGSRITLTARLLDPWVEVAVEDNGGGFPPDLEKKLFQKFTRGKTESTIAGFGLGLAIVRAIVEAHGGSVRAENLSAGGVSFILRLPMGSPPAIPEELS
ncbi:MAG: DUF4118 domain-containing protein [Magnetococcus sp. DMHC-6]